MCSVNDLTAAVSIFIVPSTCVALPFFDPWLSFADVAAEKNQQTLMSGIEKFDQANLKHTETQEKNLLPDKDGKVFSFSKDRAKRKRKKRGTIRN